MAGIRAIADIQAEGLRAASELLDRVLDRVPPAPLPAVASGGREYSSLLDDWASLLERFAAGLAKTGEEDVTLVRLDSQAIGPPLRIRQAGGESSETVICLHNAAANAVGPLCLDSSRLISPDGTPLDGAHLRFAPREIKQLPARSSLGVVVSLGAECPLRQGVYRGTVQAQGAPALWLPVEVTVES